MLKMISVAKQTIRALPYKVNITALIFFWRNRGNLKHETPSKTYRDYIRGRKSVVSRMLKLSADFVVTEEEKKNRIKPQGAHKRETG
jgi:hypothetical protein